WRAEGSGSSEGIRVIGLYCWKSQNRLANRGLTNRLVRHRLVGEESVLLSWNGHRTVRLWLLSSGIGNGSKRGRCHRLLLNLWVRLLLKRVLRLNGWKFLNKRLIERLCCRRRIIRWRGSRISGRRT